MEIQELKHKFDDFLKSYDELKYTKIWEQNSNKFRNFWENRILKQDVNELNDDEIDEIIRILDVKAKGNTKDDQAVAMVLIPMGAWRKLFREIKSNEQIKKIVDKILKTHGEEIILAIDELYEINKDNKNRLTGKSANAINTMLAAFNPKENLSAVSLNDREKIIDYFNFEGPNFEEDSTGKKIYLTNKAIIDGFSSLCIKTNARTITVFLYSLKNHWKGVLSEALEEQTYAEEISEEKIEELEEKYYQKLIHRNFKKLFPELEYYEPGQQNNRDGHFKADKDDMDFLAKDKEGNFVVIELKISGTDKTLGQIQRYMGWVKKYLCKNSQEVRGMIISENRDKKLECALEVAPDVKFKRMWIDAHIQDWNGKENNTIK